MRTLYTIALIIIYTATQGQVNKYGIPFITNYPPSEYKASEQNWAIVQDSTGLMYFGNNDFGILEYDGVSWRKIKVTNNNNSITRSLAVDKNNQLFVGTIKDFGKLSISKSGKYYYNSLLNVLKDSVGEYADIWKTYAFNDKICFCSETYIFQYANNAIKPIKLPSKSFLSFKVDTTIYTTNFSEGLYELKNNKFDLVKGFGNFKQKGIFTINKFKNRLIVGTFPDGLFDYDPMSGQLDNKIQYSKANSFAKDYQLYSSCNIGQNELLLGTIQNGIIIIDSTFKITSHINKSTGLQDDIIIFPQNDSYNNIWLGLNNGISKVEYNNPIRKFSEEEGIRGSVNDICYFNNQIFVGTTLGVFYKKLNSNDGFKQLDQIDAQTWSLLSFEHGSTKQLLIGTIYGLYSIDDKGKVVYYQEINKDEVNTCYIQKLYLNETTNEVIIGHYEGAVPIRFIEGKWKRGKEYFTENYDIRHILGDKAGNIWFATYLEGLIKVENDKIIQFDESNGLPSLSGICLLSVNDDIYLGTHDGFYKYNSANQSFFKDSLLFDINSTVWKNKNDKQGNIWVSLYNDKQRWIEKLKFPTNNEKYIRDTLPFKRLPNEQFDVIYHDEKNGITWLGSASGLYSFNNNIKISYDKPYNTLVRKVRTKKDSVLFWGENYKIKNNGDTIPSIKQPIDLIPELEYYYNDLTFEFASPYFIEENKTKYSYKLEGYNTQWSKWSLETKAVFTNLSEGEYAFKAKAKNIYGFESTVAEYKFIISPPWYRTIVAYIAYVILGIFILIIAVKLYTRKLEHEKIILEGIVQERTAEIRQQNEVLKEQKEEILKQKEEITSSITYAQRIQRAIVPSAEKAACALKDFMLLWNPRDIVSGDFWWMGEKDNYVVVTAADCTGHGVPGAFMSMLGVSFLNEIVKQQGITESGEILNRLRDKVKVTLGQTDEGSTNKDGMDIALMVIDFDNMQAQFSGAYNPLYQYRNGELIETKATRNPIGVYIKEKPFEQNLIELQKDDVLYMFSDGFPDQFGGEKEKKYSTKRFKQLLLEIHTKPMDEQKAILNNELVDWRGPVEQIDDVIILGIRI